MLYEVIVTDDALDEITDTAIIEAPTPRGGDVPAPLLNWAIKVARDRCVLLENANPARIAVVTLEIATFLPKRIGYLPENNRPHPTSCTMVELRVNRQGAC